MYDDMAVYVLRTVRRLLLDIREQLARRDGNVVAREHLGDMDIVEVSVIDDVKHIASLVDKLVAEYPLLATDDMTRKTLIAVSRALYKLEIHLFNDLEAYSVNDSEKT